jgi:hypothetical protein
VAGEHAGTPHDPTTASITYLRNSDLISATLIVARSGSVTNYSVTNQGEFALHKAEAINSIELAENDAHLSVALTNALSDTEFRITKKDFAKMGIIIESKRS